METDSAPAAAATADAKVDTAKGEKQAEGAEEGKEAGEKKAAAEPEPSSYQIENPARVVPAQVRWSRALSCHRFALHRDAAWPSIVCAACVPLEPDVSWQRASEFEPTGQRIQEWLPCSGCPQNAL